MIIYTPYTYLVGWSALGKYYYGSEYGCKTKIANPDNLWQTYFTSSLIVLEHRRLYGEPDVIEIRKTFKTATEALKWEQKVLQRINAIQSDKWLNKQAGGTCAGTTKGNRTPRTEKQKETASKTLKETMSKRKSGTFTGRKHTPESIEKMRQARYRVLGISV